MVVRELRGAFLIGVGSLVDRGGPITFDSRSGASFLTLVLLGFVGGSSVLPEVEWWSRLIV